MSSPNGTRRLDWILSPEPSLVPDGPGAGLTLGVLALQGDFREHRRVLERLGAATREVRRAEHLLGLDGLVIPGGESTTIGKLMDAYGMAGPIAAFHRHGGVVYGTCAGLITVARDTVEGTPPTLGLMDIVARRNAFGRQVRSFEADLDVEGIGRRAGARRLHPRAVDRERRSGRRGAGELRGPHRRGARRAACWSRRSTRSSPTTRACTSCSSR